MVPKVLRLYFFTLIYLFSFFCTVNRCYLPTGRIEISRIGGGKPVVWHMADLLRITQTEPDPKVEIVRTVIEEQTRYVM